MTARRHGQLTRSGSRTGSAMTPREPLLGTRNELLVNAALPEFSQMRTFEHRSPVSQKCQKRTSRK